MKANEAPEKIYLQQYDEDTLICLNEWNISEEWTEKPCNEKIATNIEYTRTDAFIEKARKWLDDHMIDYMEFDEYSEMLCGFDEDKMLKDFVKYMKGE